MAVFSGATRFLSDPDAAPQAAVTGVKVPWQLITSAFQEASSWASVVSWTLKERRVS
jgi:hypothetical protein